MDIVPELSPFFRGPQHLVHKPESPEAFLLDAGAPVRQSFTYATELPEGHPLFDDVAAPFHDLLFPVEALRHAALFAARQYFRVPPQRITAVSASGTEITDVTPWRRSGGPARLALELALTPVNVITGVPRGLECEAVVSIGGRRCGTAGAELVFLSPGVHRGHREAGRRQSEQSLLAGHGQFTVTGVPAPERVGRRSSRNVLVGLPVEGEDERLVFPVDLDAAGQVLGDEVPAALFLEASRQAALMAAAELHGFVTSHALLTHWHGAFRGFAEPALPLHCAVHAQKPDEGGVVRDAAGQPTARLRLDFLQGDREVARVSASVLQDC
ncbi:AfsA-related hotdog domain-containing protein [Streptomyces sp. NPDC059900]|uniref:AfsA-related hotdog domain-containing protein n=1 Tax=Streptomyces sp. NPDC059900 TaxID=3155816 RepID=UPI00341D0CA4